MFWKELWESHGGRVLGVVSASALFFIYLFFGFWNMLFCALLVYIGYTIGKNKDLNQGSLIPWKVIWDWLMSRWRPFK